MYVSKAGDHYLLLYSKLNPYMIVFLTTGLTSWSEAHVVDMCHLSPVWCLQPSVAVRLGSGITGYWRSLSIKRRKGLASETSQWVNCPPVATNGIAAQSHENLLGPLGALYDCRVVVILIVLDIIKSLWLWCVWCRAAWRMIFFSAAWWSAVWRLP